MCPRFFFHLFSPLCPSSFCVLSLLFTSTPPPLLTFYSFVAHLCSLVLQSLHTFMCQPSFFTLALPSASMTRLSFYSLPLCCHDFLGFVVDAFVLSDINSFTSFLQRAENVTSFSLKMKSVYLTSSFLNMRSFMFRSECSLVITILQILVLVCLF